MKFTIQISAEDYIYANKLNTKRMFLIFIRIAFVYGIIAWMSWYFGLVSIFFFIFSLVFIAYYFLWYFILIPSRIRTIYQQQKKLQKPHEFEVNETGFVMTESNNHVQYAWSEISRWKSDENVILIYPSDITFIIFPKKSFANKDDFNLLKEILNKSGVSKKKKIDWKTWKYLLVFFVIICIFSVIAGYFNLFG